MRARARGDLPTLAIRSSPHTGFSMAILRIRIRSSAGIRGRPGRHFHLHNSLQPARRHRIMVFVRTTNGASRHSKNPARMAKLIRVAESTLRGWIPRSLNSASCRRRNRFSAWTGRVGRNRRMENRTASARRWTAILMNATMRSSCHSLAPQVASSAWTTTARIFAEHRSDDYPRRECCAGPEHQYRESKRPGGASIPFPHGSRYLVCWTENVFPAIVSVPLRFLEGPP